MQARYRAGGMGYGTSKKELLAKIKEHFAPMREKREELAQNMDYVNDVLREGAKRASVVARDTLVKASIAVGLE